MTHFVIICEKLSKWKNRKYWKIENNFKNDKSMIQNWLKLSQIVFEYKFNVWKTNREYSDYMNVTSTWRTTWQNK